MIPAGYLLKRVSPAVDWLKVPRVTSICSVADCVSENVVDVQRAWLHNGHGVASDPETLRQLAHETGAEIANARFFYYEVHELEMDSDDLGTTTWRPLSRVPSSSLDTPVVTPPGSTRLLGYDVVVFEDFLSHSPLSCNSVAEHLPVNACCLLETLDDARQAIEAGAFNHCEPGVYTIFAVHEAEWR